MTIKKYRRLLILVAFILFVSATGRAATYTVTNTNDSGAGSLRQAILDANNSGAADVIVFSIPGSGVRTITPLSDLPEVGNTGVLSGIAAEITIDGTTQPGYAGTPLIEINASNMTYGLSIDVCVGLTSAPATIRGLIINRASSDGILIECAESATITASYIGTNSSGTTDLGNGSHGIHIRTNSPVTVGGAGTSQRNIISGNNGSGIRANATTFANSVRIFNNYIGTNAAGTVDLGNTLHGIHVTKAVVEIGGTSGPPFDLDLGNVISGNNGNGIFLDDNLHEASIKRNLIGTNAAGSAGLANSQNGISIFKSVPDTLAHSIGSSTDPLDGNTISGNGAGVTEGNGIKIENVGGVQIFSNRIGTNSAGAADVGNLRNGVELINAPDTQIGFAGRSSARNTIGGNNLHGVLISGAGSTGNLIRNNFIGTNSSSANLGNGGDGIIFTNVSPTTASLNVVGGDTSAAGNTIAFNQNGHGVNIATASTGNTVRFNTIHSNAGSGVNVSSSASNGNTIIQNALYSNQGLGINLGASGVTPNDLNDPDAGANNLQNFPVLQRVSPTRIIGTLNSIANHNFTIEFYRVDSCDNSGHGQGRYHLASTNVTSTGNNAAFNFAYSGLSVGQIVTATATDSSGNTSEFSQCVTVTPDSGDFQLSSATYLIGENGGAAVITVNRVGGSSGALAVDYATANGTATAGLDYTAASGTLTFASGEISKTFSIGITNDLGDEPDETFNVALSNPTGGALLLSPSSAVVTINDNDNPPIVSISDLSLEEGNSGTTNFNFTVSLSQASGFDVAANYATANGTATSGVDFAPVNAAVNFAPGEVSKQLSVQVYGELTVEIDETFFVNLTAPINATIPDAQGVGTILDDDNPGRLQFVTSPYTTAEGTSVLVTVTRTSGDAGTVSVDYNTTGVSATPTVDYTPAAGTLIFNDGETTKTFSAVTLQDVAVEPSENFNIVLSNPIGGATLGPISSTTVNILDDDGGTLLSISGRVLKTDATPLVGAVVNLAGTQTGSTTTDADGDFTFSNLAPNGDFSVAPSAIGFTFDPVAREYLDVSTDIINANFTATSAPTRQLRFVGGDATPGTPVNAVVELVAQGNENSLGLSLNYDSSILSSPVVVLTADAASATLSTNTSQTGKLGVLLALPAGQSFAAGTKSLVTITFNTSATGAYNSPVTFGDAPIVRQIANTNADPLPASYVNGQVTFAQRYEADVAPRPTGSNNGSVTVADFTQIGRFVAGLDTPDQLNEFQRADCAPRIFKGNGSLSVSDYTQAGRYAAALDVVQTAGGQTAPSLVAGLNSLRQSEAFALGSTVVRVVSAQAAAGSQVVLAIEAVANGNENAFGFTLNYDPTKLSSPLVTLGTDTQNASLITNTGTPGRIGVVIGLPIGQALPAGTRQLVTVRFDVAANAPSGATLLTFGDQPVVREVVDVNGDPVTVSFENGSINILAPTAAMVAISGRVMTTGAYGIPNARLSLTNLATGEIRTVISSSFGYYRFEDVEVGAFYSVTVSSKRYFFDPDTRVVDLVDELIDLNFIATEDQSNKE